MIRSAVATLALFFIAVTPASAQTTITYQEDPCEYVRRYTNVDADFALPIPAGQPGEGLWLLCPLNP